MSEPEVIRYGSYEDYVEDKPLETSEFPDSIPTDEPEQITEEEALASDLKPETVELNEDAGHLTELVCGVCLELNLTAKSAIECKRCGHAFCFHYASATDVEYCVNCLSDISLTRQVVTKTYTSKNSETGEQTFYRRRAREIKIDGLSWLFAQRKIVELSDVELDLAIEYHRNICSLMLDESERRRNEKMHRYANTQFKIPTPATTKVTNGTETTVKKTKTVSKDKASEQIAALMKAMLAKGMRPEQLAALLGGKK